MGMVKLIEEIIPWKIPVIWKKLETRCRSSLLVLILVPLGRTLMCLLLDSELLNNIGTHQVHYIGLPFIGRMCLLLEKIFWIRYGIRNIQMIPIEFILKD